MGGIGKSELMSYWVHQVSNQKIAGINYQHVIYVNCSNDIETGFLTNSNILEKLGISDQIEDKDTDKLSIITAALNQLEHLLLVLDDLPWNEPAITNCNAQLAYLKTLSCQIISTSRSQDYQQFQPINISSLSEDECINLFAKYSKVAFIENDSIIKKVIDLAGRHTLTIELLAKTAYRQQYTPAELLDKLKTNKFNINTKIRYDKDLNSAYEDIDTALGKLFAISGLTEQQQKILYHLSLMDSQVVSLDLLNKWLGNDIINDRSVLIDLVTSGWLQEALTNDNLDSNSQSQVAKSTQYYLHQVVSHTVVSQFCYKYEDEARNNFFRPVARNIKQYYKNFDTYSTNHQRLHNREPQELQLKKACLPALAAYLRNSVHFTSNAEQLEYFTITLNDFTLFCGQQGIYTLGLTLLLDCLEHIKSTLGKQNLQYSSSLNILSNLYEKIGNYQQALLLSKQSLTIVETQLGRQHPDYATNLNNLAGLYETTGNYEKALLLYKQAVDIVEKKLGKQHLDYATVLNNLACLYKSMDCYEEAIPLFKSALYVRKIQLSKYHPDYASSLNNLALVYENLGEYKLALPLFKEALEIISNELGEQHPYFAITLNNLALVYRGISDYQQALALHKKALAIIKDQLGEQHPEYASALNNISLVYKEMGDYSQAFSFCKQSINIRKTQLEEYHPSYAMSLNNLARLFESTNDYKQALPLYEQAITIAVLALGEEHRYTQGIKYNYLRAKIANSKE